MLVLTANNLTEVKEVRGGFMKYNLTYDGPDPNGGYIYTVTKTTPDNIKTPITFTVKDYEIRALKDMSLVDLWHNLDKMTNGTPFVAVLVLREDYDSSSLNVNTFDPFRKQMRYGMVYEEHAYLYRCIIMDEHTPKEIIWKDAVKAFKESDLYDGRFD